jgi:hypothetical protein
LVADGSFDAKQQPSVRDDEGVDDGTRHPIADVIGRLEVAPVPHGWQPIEAALLIKCLDDEGNPAWAFRTTDGVNDEELLGTLIVRSDMLRAEILSQFS